MLKKRQVSLTIVLVLIVAFILPLSSFSSDNGLIVPESSTMFSTVDIASTGIRVPRTFGDLWPTAWAPDGYLYTANGDGHGEEEQTNWTMSNGTRYDIVVSRIGGSPGDDGSGIPDMTVEALLRCRKNMNNTPGTGISQEWAIGNGRRYSRKPTGMLCRDGILYCAVQNLGDTGDWTFNEAPAATICKSEDLGLTWTWDTTKPMFDNYMFTTLFFLDYGQDSQWAPDDYVYAYGLDGNWRASFSHVVPEPTSLYLARVHKDHIMERAAWEFYTGDLEGGNISWTSDITQKMPVLTDETIVYPVAPNFSGSTNVKAFGLISQGGVVYNKPLDRYLYTSWTEYTFDFYEAPTPFGPWKKFMMEDFSGYQWQVANRYGGYPTTIPSKFISDDGKTMWVQASTWAGMASQNTSVRTTYTFNIRKLVVEPFDGALKPANSHNEDNLAMPENAPGVTPSYRAIQYGRKSVFNDGIKNSVANNSDTSWTGEAKKEDWWGYTYPRPYKMNAVVYKAGNQFADGGWFKDLRVQVRQNFEWIDVTDMMVADGTDHIPALPYDELIFSFDDTWGDAVRVVGTPGGSQCFTSLNELEVYYYPKNVTPTASVVKQNGNNNQLIITLAVIDYYGEEKIITETFIINNNAADYYNVGPYTVYVDTKGNTQIRECYVVED